MRIADAWVAANNLKAYVTERYDPARQPSGDPDCRLGVKRSSNQEQPDGTTKERKEFVWGYGTGVVAATDPRYGDVVLAEYTQPFNEVDSTYYHPLYQRTVATLGFPPPTSRQMPPLMPGTSIKRVRNRAGWRRSHSTRAGMQRHSWDRMESPCVPKAWN